MIIPSDLKKWLKMRIPNCIYSSAVLLYIEALEEDVGGKIAETAQLENRIKQLERERDAAVRTAQWQFERRGKDGVTELPVCSGCGATPKYYAPKNDEGMQVPPYCHECGSKMAAVVKMEVE